MRNTPPSHRRLAVFALFPVVLGLGITWLYAYIFTVAGVYDSSSPQTQVRAAGRQALRAAARRPPMPTWHRCRHPRGITLQAACTTSNAIIDETPWIRLPYPGQWGAPIMSWQSEPAASGQTCEGRRWRPCRALAPTLVPPLPLPPLLLRAGTVTLLAAVIPASLESIGDYYACARLSGAPQPPTEVVSRALGVEALCCLVAGLFGTGSGSTACECSHGCCWVGRGHEAVTGLLCGSGLATAAPPPSVPALPDAENVGAISITGVASRRVTQVGAAIMMLLGIIGKFGALFASIPQALVAGMFTIMFSLISGVGELCCCPAVAQRAAACRLGPPRWAAVPFHCSAHTPTHS